MGTWLPAELSRPPHAAGEDHNRRARAHPAYDCRAEALDGLRELQRAIGACFAGADRAVLDGGLATARAAFALAPAWTALALVLALAIDDSHRAAPRRAARTPADRHPGTTTN